MHIEAAHDVVHFPLAVPDMDFFMIIRRTSMEELQEIVIVRYLR